VILTLPVLTPTITAVNILLIFVNTHIKVPKSQSLFLSFVPNVILSSSSSKHVKWKTGGEIEECISRIWLSDELIVFQANTNILNDVLTLIDSGVSNHYFVDKFLFILYISYNLLKLGLSTDKDFTFTISGKWLV